LLVFALGCGGRGHVRKPENADQVWLAAIKVVGNKTIDTDDLVPGLALDRARRDGHPADPYQLSLDIQRIKNAYTRLGFFDAKVDGQIDRDDNAETVVFTVLEGPRLHARVEIVGLPPEVSEAKARKLIALRDGAPFDYELYDDAKEPLKLLVEEAGYAHVDLYAAVTVDKSRGVAVASYALDPGDRARFGDIKIVGATGELLDAIEVRRTFGAGETYSPRALVATQRAISELGRFSSVRIEVDRTQGKVVPVTITVSPADRHELRLGAGAGYEPLTYELRARGGYYYVPADYPLWTLAADGRLAETWNHDLEDPKTKLRVLTTAQRYDFLRPRMTGDIGVGFDYLTVEAYTSTGPQLRLGVGSPLGARWLTARAGWAFSYLDFTDISAVLDPVTRRALGLGGNERLGTFEQAVIADLRDDPIAPHKGGFVSLRVTEGTKFAGGAFQYLELQPDLRAYVPLGPLVLAFRLRGGSIYGDIPITQRFFSGGPQGHRGFSDRQLAPSVSGTVDGTIRSVLIGGTDYIETGAELRIPIGHVWSLPVGATVFIDGGDVTAEPDSIDVWNLHWAAGPGLWLKLGALKIGLDVGYRLNRQTEPGILANKRFHLSIGETF
jgi:translocation and assembly module TamA